jgi:hypothetical protein
LLRRFKTAWILVGLTTTLVAGCADDDAGAGAGGGGGAGADAGAGGAGGDPVTHETWSIEEAWTVQAAASIQRPLDVAATADGSVYVLGSNGSGYVVARYDAEGALVDGFPASVSSELIPHQFQVSPVIAAAPDGSAVVAGMGDAGWSLVQIDAAGSQGWTASHDGPDFLSDIVATSEGLAVIGYALDLSQGFACHIARFDTSGALEGTFAPSTVGGAADELTMCDAAASDPATGDLQILGVAQAELPPYGPFPLAAVARVAADLSSASVTRDVFDQANGGEYGRLAVLADGTTFASRTSTDAYAPRSIAGVVSGERRRRWWSGQAQVAGLDEEPVAVVVQAQRPGSPIDARVVDAEMSELATTRAATGDGSELVAVDASGGSVWALWRADDAMAVERGFVARFDVSRSTVEGEAPQPPEPKVDVDPQGSATVSGQVTRIASTADGAVYALSGSGPLWSVRRFEADGSVSPGAWPHEIYLPLPEPELQSRAHPAIAAMPDGSLVVAALGSYGWETQRLLADGTVDWTAEYDSGPDDYPAGIVVDAAGRVVVFGSPGTYQGTPHLDCWAIRYSADGELDEGFELAVTEDGPSGIVRCGAGTLDAAAGDVALLGSSMPFQGPGGGTYFLGRGLARIGADGAYREPGAADADLFGELETSWLLELRVQQGDLVSLSDGTLVAALSPPPSASGFQVTRLAFVEPGGAAVSDEAWGVGAVRVAALDGERIVRLRHEWRYDPMHLEIVERNEGATEVVGATSFEVERGAGFPIAVSSPGDGTFWVAFMDGEATALERFATEAR